MRTILNIIQVKVNIVFDSENKNKLIRQIGNTALFFMKTQIPGTGDQV
jgi:hypothetical protein